MPPRNESAQVRHAVADAMRWDVSPTAAILAEALPLVLNMDSDPLKIEQTLSRDPVLVGLLLSEVNSALFHLSRPVASLRQAIVMLGRQRLGDLCFTALMREWVRKKKRSARHQAWLDHSVASAVLAEVLRESAGLEWQEAYTSGLLHDIGRLALMELIEPGNGDHGEHCWGNPAPGLAHEQELIGVDHCQAGTWLLQDWRLPSAVTDCCLRHHELGEGLSAPLVMVQLSCALATRLGYGATGRTAPEDDAIAERYGKATRGGVLPDLAGLSAVLTQRVGPPRA